MWASLLEAAQVVFTLHSLTYIVIGMLLGHFFGMLPGLSGMIAVAILIPLSYTMDLNTAMVFLISILGGGTFAGSITAIFFGIPGTAMNAMTVLDGHPLALQGKGAMALGASATASAMGSLVSFVILIPFIPIASKIVLMFGAPEKFMIVLLGVLAINLTATGNMLRGLVSGILGMILSYIGFSTVTGGERYTLGFDYFWDGIPMISLFIGSYAVAEFIDKCSQPEKTAKSDVQRGEGLLEGVKAVFKNWFLFLRCTVISYFVGATPGLGGNAAAVMCYAHAKQSLKNTENFGKGDIRGVIAAETANNAKDGGQLLPTLSLGIPGSSAMAILLGAFLIQGIQPGTNVFSTDLNLIFVILIAYAISNVITSLFGMFVSIHVVKIIQWPSALYMPIICVIASVGAYVSQYNIYDIYLALAFGLVGYFIKIMNYSRINYVIGFILGPLLEHSYWQSLQVSRGSYSIFFNNSTITVVFWVLIVLFGVYLVYKSRKKAAEKKAAGK